MATMSMAISRAPKETSSLIETYTKMSRAIQRIPESKRVEHAKETTNPNLLRFLSFDEQSATLVEVGGNIHTKTNVLNFLAKLTLNENIFKFIDRKAIAMAIIGNPNSTSRTFSILSNFKDREIKEILVEKQLPEEDKMQLERYLRVTKPFVSFLRIIGYS